jgi:hypothetical protein
MPTWPTTLPQHPLLDRYSETAPETAIRTEMDSGPAKSRRRTSAGVRRISCVYLLDAAQTAALDAFFISATAGGSVPFDMNHPRTAAAASFRFRKPPVYTPAGRGHYHAALDLEVLP